MRVAFRVVNPDREGKRYIYIYIYIYITNGYTLQMVI